MRAAFAALGVLAGALALAVSVPSAAEAAVALTAPTYTDDASGSGPVRGVNYSALEYIATSHPTPIYDAGGWGGPTAITSLRAAGSPYDAAHTQPVVCWLNNPVNYYGAVNVAIPITCKHFDSDPSGISSQVTLSSATVTCAPHAHNLSTDTFGVGGFGGGVGYVSNMAHPADTDLVSVASSYGSACPYLVSVSVTLHYYADVADGSPDGATSASFTWTANQVFESPTALDPADGDLAAVCNATNESVRDPSCAAILASGDAPINCHWDWGTTGDWFADFATWVGGATPWFGCMFIPQGWDRSHKLADAMAHGSAATSISALGAALPSSLACGSVGTLPVLGGGTIPLNTCGLDVMPTPFKNVIGFALALPIAWLGVKRIFWSLGGDSAPNVKVGKS